MTPAEPKRGSAEEGLAQHAPAEGGELVSGLLEAIPNGGVSIGPEGQITPANAAAETILGLQRSRIAGRTFDAPEWANTSLDGSPLAPEDLPVARVFRDGRAVHDVQHATHRPDGSKIYLSVNAAPLRDEEGNLTGVIASFTDITNNKRTEAERDELARRFVELMANVSLIGLILDTRGRIAFANRFLLELTGRTDEEVLGNNWFELFIPETRPEIRAIFDAAIGSGDIPSHYENEVITASGDLRAVSWSNTRQGSETPYEAAGLKKDGTIFAGELRGSPIIYGGRSARVTAVRDISERKQTEDLLRAADASRRDLLSRLVAAQEEERKRIADDVHDDSIQIVSAAGMRASTLKTKLKDHPELASDIAKLEETINLAVSRLASLSSISVQECSRRAGWRRRCATCSRICPTR